MTTGKTTTGEAVRIETMRAIVQTEYGSTDVLGVAEVARPEPGPTEVLIEVRAAGVDRGVWHLMAGLPYLVRIAGFGVTRPKIQIPGLDVAGRVVAVGAAVERFSVGDEVFGIGSGTYAEYAVADESKLAHRPAELDAEAAAVASISGITALQALTDVADVREGMHVLVIGASGGVGMYAVQIAKALGAHVTGVASGSKAEFVLSLGADRVVDYEREDFLDGDERYDVVVDVGGLNPVRKLRRSLTRAGTLVVVGGEGGGRWTGGVGRQLRAVLASPFVPQRLTTFISTEHHSHIERLAGMIERGEVTPAVSRAYRLEQVPEALDDLTSGQARGKSVIVVR